MTTRNFSHRAILQRRSAPFRISDRFPDCVLYYCPVRDALAVALEDKYANYWTAPEWHQGGSYVFTYYKGDVLWSEPLEGNPADIFREITEELMKQLNGFCNQDETRRDRLAATLVDTMRGVAAIETLCDVFDKGEDDVEYRAFRAGWAEHFESIYPRPEGAQRGSHEITTRVARTRHAIICRRHRSLERKKQELKAESTLVADILTETMQRG